MYDKCVEANVASAGLCMPFSLECMHYALKSFEVKSGDVWDLPLGQVADYDLCVLYVVTLRQMRCYTMGA